MLLLFRGLLFLLLWILFPWWLCGAMRTKQCSRLTKSLLLFSFPAIFLTWFFLDTAISNARGLPISDTVHLVGTASAYCAIFILLFLPARKFGYLGVIFPQILPFLLLVIYEDSKVDRCCCEKADILSRIIDIAVPFLIYEAYFLLCVFIFWGAGKAIKHFRKKRAPAEGKFLNVDETDLSR